MSSNDNKLMINIFSDSCWNLKFTSYLPPARLIVDSYQMVKWGPGLTAFNKALIYAAFNLDRFLVHVH